MTHEPHNKSASVGMNDGEPLNAASPDGKRQVPDCDSSGGVPARWVFGASAIAVLGWFTLLSVYKTGPIVDEGTHLLAVRWFYVGHWEWPPFLPMLPAYHLIALALAKVVGAYLITLRVVSAVFAIAGIACWASALQRLTDRSSEEASTRTATGSIGVLLYTLNPLLFPFHAMAYTESTAMCFVALAVLLHTRRRYGFSALAMGAASLVRQSNVIWLAWLLVWVLIDSVRDRNAGAARASPPETKLSAADHNTRRLRLWLSRGWVHLALMLTAVIIFVWAGRFTPVDVNANRARFNIAQFYLFAACMLLMFAPLWLARLRESWIGLARWVAKRPHRGAVLLPLGVASAIGLVMGFSNPHPWNTITGVNGFVRNWFLVGMEDHSSLRIVFTVSLLAACPPVWMCVRTQPRAARSMLIATAMITLVYLLPLALAEPRYYILPAVFFGLFYRFSVAEARRQTGWYLLLTLCLCGFILVYGHSDGGML